MAILQGRVSGWQVQPEWVQQALWSPLVPHWRVQSFPDVT
jgi:hypothetical protein